MQVLSDRRARDLARLLRDDLQRTSEVRLFRVDITPTPATRVMDLIEPTGDSYEPWVLTERWGEAHKVTDGLWYTEAEEVTWQPPAVGRWSAFGYYVLSADGLEVVERFPAPVSFVPGGPPFSLRVRIYVGSVSVVCAEPDFFDNGSP